MNAGRKRCSGHVADLFGFDTTAEAAMAAWERQIATKNGGMPVAGAVDTSATLRDVWLNSGPRGIHTPPFVTGGSHISTCSRGVVVGVACRGHGSS